MFSLLEKKKGFNGLKNISVRKLLIDQHLPFHGYFCLLFPSAAPTAPRTRTISLASGAWNPCKRELKKDFKSCSKFTQDWQSTTAYNDSIEKESRCRTFLFPVQPLHGTALLWPKNSQESSPGSWTLSIFRTRISIFGSTVICLPSKQMFSPPLPIFVAKESDSHIY